MRRDKLTPKPPNTHFLTQTEEKYLLSLSSYERMSERYGQKYDWAGYGGSAAHGSILVEKLGSQLTNKGHKGFEKSLFLCLLLQAVRIVAAFRTEEPQDFSIFHYKI